MAGVRTNDHEMFASRRHALLCLVALVSIAGCTASEPGFGPIEYGQAELNVTVVTDAPIAHASLQVAVSALDPLGQREVFAEARYVDIAAGTNRYTYRLELPPGTYRCYLHLHEGDERRAAVIRELTVPGERSRG